MTPLKFKLILCFLGAVLLSYAFGAPPWASVLGLFTATVWCLGGIVFLKRLARTLFRDMRLICAGISIANSMRHHAQNNVIIPDLFEQTVCSHPEKVAIIFDEEQWTFRQLKEFSNRVANYFLGAGLKKGDTVALFMENCPEFVGVWLGLGKIGVVSAFINSNLRQHSLVHSIKVANPCAIIFSCPLGGALGDVVPMLDEENVACGCYSVKGESHLPLARSMEAELCDSAPSPPPKLKDKSFEDKLCYIFTSGTTGPPKPSVIKHRRFFGGSWGQSYFFHFKPNDVLYCTLPLYHSLGGICAVGTMLLKGSTLVLRKKFSASNFWSDCHKHKCTVVYYIGDLCRYLLAQPPSPSDRNHCVRLAIGNGLRPQLWGQFKTRFDIAQIGEFYAATEGIAAFLNIENKEGSVGAMPLLIQLMGTVALLKVDPETNEHVRDSKGYCVRAGYNEPGEVVARIEDSNLMVRFDGYNDIGATKKKILHDVFAKGDAYFMSGDILKMDEDGNMYFCDRTGDTFRCKGENVSTTEVESVMMRILEHRNICVYGVEVPEAEGRVGMASIAGDQALWLEVPTLAQRLFTELPSYAVPIFLRIVPSIDMTSTYRIQKNRLRSEGYNVKNITDPLFVLEFVERKYMPLDGYRFEQVMSGRCRL